MRFVHFGEASAIIFRCLTIYVQMSRSGVGGPAGSLTAGMAYGIPPLIKYASAELQEKVLPDLLTGKVRACIAITEPDAGSDVANITTVAKKSADGKEYIINGTKKWYLHIFCISKVMRIKLTFFQGSQTVSGPNIAPWLCAPVLPTREQQGFPSSWYL